MKEIGFDFTKLEKVEEQLDDENLKELLKNFHQSCSNLVYSLSLPLILTTYGIRNAREGIEFITYLFNEIPRGSDLSNFKPGTDEFKKLTQKFQAYSITVKQLENTDFDLAFEDLKKLKQNVKINVALNSLYLNIIANSWGVFESISKDLWISILNDNPEKLLTNSIYEYNLKNQVVEGLQGKLISLPILGKYDFNIKHHLGTLLSEKFDFTGCNGIKVAYEKLFYKNKTAFSFIVNSKLICLEKLRHLIVHQGGKVDEKFIKESKFQVNIGSVFSSDIEQATEYINLVIESGSKLVDIIYKNIEKYGH